MRINYLGGGGKAEREVNIWNDALILLSLLSCMNIKKINETNELVLGKQ